MKRYLFFILLLSGLALSVRAQYVSSYYYRNIVTVASSNGRYHAKCIPARNIENTVFGTTEVFEAQSGQTLYTIPTSLADGYTFVSNDGQTVLHLVNRELHFDDEPLIAHAVTFYHKGTLSGRHIMNELLSDKYCRRLFYYKDAIFNPDSNLQFQSQPVPSERDKLLLDFPAFADGDTVFVYTATRQLLRIHLPSQHIDILPFSYHSEAQLRHLIDNGHPPVRINGFGHNNIVDTVRFKCPSEYVQIKGLDHEEALAAQMHMVPQGDTYSTQYKYYYLRMLLRIDRQGNATIVQLDNSDSLSEKAIRRAVSRLEYYVDDFPDGIDCWYQKLFGSMRKRNKRVARREGTQEWEQRQARYKQRIVADSIDGVYIPRNMEDCFHTLDSLLNPHDRNHIKACNGELGQFHFSLGLWIRNNWGLWGGSRLQCYLYDRGTYHPDDMSGQILRFYYDHLWGRDSAWQAFDTTLVPPPPPDTATVAITRYRVVDRQMKRILDRVIDGKTCFSSEDQEDFPLEEEAYCIMELQCFPTDDSTFAELSKELAEDSEYITDLSCKNPSPKHPFYCDKPFVLLTVASYEDYQKRPVKGYIHYRGHNFYLVDNGTPLEQFDKLIKPTQKTRRFWKPRKYLLDEEIRYNHTYTFQNNQWYIIYEL